ncbi:Hypothetical protein NocV09_08400020 [Nannochloropsis oceanica]
MSAVRDALASPQRALQSQALVQSLLDKGPVPGPQREFLINGWRWHSRSVLRDVRRFKEVAKRERRELMTGVEGPSRLPACYDFFWSFSWVALLKIESDIFYPFLRKTLPKDLRPVLDDLEEQGRQVATLGQRLGLVLQAFRDPSSSPSSPPPSLPSSSSSHLARLDDALALAGELEVRAEGLIDQQEEVLVPVVAAYLTGREQKKFNNKVIASLGIFNSRVHLVSMAEAVRGDAVEEMKFKGQIPGIAQALLGRWRERLYRPLAVCLE